MSPCGEVSARDLEEAVAIYLRRVYASCVPDTLPKLVPGLAIEEHLRHLRDETCPYDGAARRWTLRLGCSHYPFMKLVLQEHLLPGRFYFSVDTHDQFVVPEHLPDFAEWREVLERNRLVRAAIEAEWEQAGLPTAARLRRELLCRLGSQGRRGGGRRPAPIGRLLLADDDEDLLVCTAILLREAGYDVVEANDGEAAWQALDAEPFDLVLVDYEMPRLDGLSLIDRVRQRDDARAALPIVLTTLAKLPSERTARASGELPKPYARAGLLRAIERFRSAAVRSA
ncbi:MAG: response regulator [Planctomycetes bacterium]|nr:response regulator [Planctomycetota bacterium]